MRSGASPIAPGPRDRVEVDVDGPPRHAELDPPYDAPRPVRGVRQGVVHVPQGCLPIVGDPALAHPAAITAALDIPGVQRGLVPAAASRHRPTTMAAPNTRRHSPPRAGVLRRLRLVLPW